MYILIYYYYLSMYKCGCKNVLRDGPLKTIMYWVSWSSSLHKGFSYILQQ